MIRPTGVSVISIIYALGALGPVSRHHILGLFWAALYIYAAVRLWQMREDGRRWAMGMAWFQLALICLAGLPILAALCIPWFAGKEPMQLKLVIVIASMALEIAFSVLVLWYLKSPSVSNLFLPKPLPS